MFLRPLLFAGVLAAAVGIPYLLYTGGKLTAAARGQMERMLGPAKSKEADPLADLTALAAAGKAAALAPSARPSVPLEEAFRFEISPAWVTSRWPRVSTVAGLPQQLGMRVAYASGTRPDDVAGSLTYYFDEHHQLVRITFTGLTADARRLVAVVLASHALQSQPTTGAAYYTAGDPQHPTSQLRVRHLGVLNSDTQQPRAEISVDLARDDAAGPSEQKSPVQIEPSLLPSSYRRW